MIQKLKKWIIYLCGVGGTLLACQQGLPGTPDYSKTPVLFVHGSGLSSKSWNKMISYLISVGYPSEYLYAVDLQPRNGSSQKAASKFIEPSVERLLQQASITAQQAGYQGQIPQRVDIVSHSMGAVSSRWYILTLHPERVRTWIAIAGANHGTNALCAYLHQGKGHQEMCPAFAIDKKKNSLQIMLNGTREEPLDETPFGLGEDRKAVQPVPPDQTRNILYFTIRIEPDRWIKPEQSAVLDGAGGLEVSISPEIPVRETSLGNYLFMKKIGHDSLPKDPELIRFVDVLLAIRNKEKGLL